MANNAWGAVALATGAAGALDDIHHSGLLNGDFCITCASGALYFHWYDIDNASAASSPDVIIPRSNSSGTGAWLLTSQTLTDFTNMTHTHLATATGGTIDKISEGNSYVEVVDAGTGTVSIVADGNTEVDVTDSGLRLGAGNARCNAILDEDAMGSNSATSLSTQQSIKAYVDNTTASIGTGAGYLERGGFAWAAANTLSLYGARYKVKDYNVSWTSTLSKTLSSLDGSSWYYIYLDYSELSDGATVTASEVIWSTTAPAWSTTYSQYMNGDDRCIFAIKSDGAASMREFWQHGDRVNFEQYVSTLALTDIDLTWTDLTLYGPIFSGKAHSRFEIATGVYSAGGVAAVFYYRPDNATNSTGIICARLVGSGTEAAPTGHITVLAQASDNVIELKASASNDAQISVNTIAWYLPDGM